jgi:hypothetical protein
MTPYGFGAEAFGRAVWNDSAHEFADVGLTVAEAVGASSAFFDSQQRKVGSGFWQPILGWLLRSVNLEWGTSIRNYNLTREQYKRSSQIHNALIWPLYLFHMHRAGATALRIRLSDGGMSENLGVWALLRRGFRQIIVADAAADLHYDLGDLCELDRQLPLLELAGTARHYLEFDDPSLQSFSRRCLTVGRYTPGDDPYGLRKKGEWPGLVVVARVCRADESPCRVENTDATLYVLKPALNWNAKDREGRSLREIEAAGLREMPESECELSATSHAASPEAQGPSLPPAYPCEVLSFIAASGEKVVNGRKNIAYPQNGTIRMTALSSPYMYGAYRELGRYYAQALAVQRVPGEGSEWRLQVRWHWIAGGTQAAAPGAMAQ